MNAPIVAPRSAIRRTIAGHGLLPLASILLVALGLIAAGCGGGGAKATTTPTKAPATSTPAPTNTPVPTPTATPAPVSAGLQSTGDTSASSTGGDGGSDYTPYEPPRYLSGPGPIEGTDMTLVIPSIGVNATVYSRTVGDNGQMGDPGGPWQAIWYDFGANNWTGLGGYPGQAGANAVFAGHVDYIGVGPAVFWSIRDLQPGDQVTVYTGAGPVNYTIQWSQWAAPDEDFTSFVAQTGQDSITLVTCIGGFSGGHYSNRIIVRGVRS
jgi:LPXTG-site transpeptidase (sortase) family protein